MNISVPLKNFGKGEDWILLNKVLGKRVIFRADAINKCKKRQVDFDKHECDEATAISSVKCKGREYLISDKILKH